METATATVVRVNWSTLRYLAVSPKLLKWRSEHPEPESPPMKLGSAIHCKILEPAEFDKRWVTAGPCVATKKDGATCGSQGSLSFSGQWYCKVKGHAPAGAFAIDDESDVQAITADERALVDACAASVRAHKIADRLFTGGVAERGIEWTDPETGIACRGRIDYLRPYEVVDLKSTHEETVRGLTRHFVTRLYYAQLAWYHDGAIRAGKIAADAPLPVIVSVSTSEPYDVAPFRLTRHAYEAGQILYRDFLLKYRDCLAADYWPGIAPGMLELDLPDWAQGMNGSAYEGGGF